MFLGYDVLDLESGERFAFARLGQFPEETARLQHSGLRFAFSTEGIRRANGVLRSITDRRPDGSLVIIDEFGRLEKARTGIYQGILGIAEKPLKGVIVCACRTDLVETVVNVFRPYISSISMHTPPALESLWSLCRYMLLCEVDLK